MPSRLTVVSLAYHHSDNGQTLPSESRFGRFLKTDELPYVRRMTLTEEWQAIDCGWFKSCSLLAVENEEGKGLDKVPTKDEAGATAKKIVEIAFGGKEGKRDMHSPPREYAASLQVAPGESERLHPVNLPSIMLRSRSGPLRCLLTIFPE